MPLEHSSSPQAFKRNVSTLMDDVGKSPHIQSKAQALAVAYETQRRARANGGLVQHFDAGGIVEPQQSPMMSAPPPGVAGASPMMMPPPPGAPQGVAPNPGAIPTPPPGQPMASGVPQNAAPPGIMQNSPAGPPSPMGVPLMASGGNLKPVNADISGAERTELRKLHIGPIVSKVPGRTDNHRAMVPAGSYVLPAQHVASMGHGNSLAGLDLASKMFGGPYNTSAMKMGHGHMGIPKSPGLGHMATGGSVHHEGQDYELVPVDLSGGEFVIPPWQITSKYGENLDNGHRVLDRWVMDTRKKEIETQKNLPPPAKD